MKSRLLKVISVLVLGLALFDCALDAAGCHEAADNCAAACPTCACASRIVAPSAPTPAAVPRPAPFVPYVAGDYGLLLPRPLFRPPRLTA